MGEAVIGYAPEDGRLILGRHRDGSGRWVEPVYTHDEVLIAAPTELDKAVLGTDTEYVIVVFRNCAGEERYRVAPEVSWYGVDEQDAQREEEILREAARRRFSPDEDENPCDMRTLAARPAARAGWPHRDVIVARAGDAPAAGADPR